MSDVPPPPPPPPEGAAPPPPPPPPPGGGYVPPPPGGYIPPPPGGYAPAGGYGGYGYAAQRIDGLATAALALGIVSILCAIGCLGIVLGPAAAIMGFISRQRISTSGGAIGGGTRALVGLILGVLGFLASVSAFFFWIFVLNQSSATPTG
jgi:Domain of unknown function (DUF4190)